MAGDRGIPNTVGFRHLPKDAWLESYAIWSTALGLPPTHERVARMVVREKLTLAVERKREVDYP